MASRRVKKDCIELKSDEHVYIHDLDSYASSNHNCTAIPLDRVTGYLGEMKNTLIASGAGTGKTVNVIQRIMSELGKDFNGDVEMISPVITSRKIMDNIVSLRFSDASIVIVSRTDYNENEVFFDDLTKDDIIREFAIEVY